MSKPTPSRLKILEDLSALADVTRSRLLLLLEEHELTVSELCTVLQLPQSTVSRHLKTLLAGGWVQPRAKGTHRLYRMAAEDLSAAAASIWSVTREDVAATSAARQDMGRLQSVMRQRRSRSEQFFSATAEQWDHVRDELFGTRFQSAALLGLLPGGMAVGDLGCGTGRISEALAPVVDRVVAVDASAPMLETARQVLQPWPNVVLRQGELEALPISDGELDAATLVLVLHHVIDPARVIAEAARVLRPGGVLLVVDMLSHDRTEYRQQMGHLWLGFSEKQLRRYLAPAGLRLERFLSLPADPAAKGPALFIALSRRPRAGTDEKKKRSRSS
jgi:ArsR family transcriptional regulator